MREDKFTKLYDDLFEIEGVTFGDVVLLSLIVSLCHYAKSNEIYLKSHTLMRRFKRSESQVKRMIRSLEEKKLIDVYCKGYSYDKMRFIQVVDERLQEFIGDVKIAPSVESQAEAKKTFYQRLNNLFAKDQISKEDAQKVANIPYVRILYYHALLRSLREIRGISVNVEPGVMGYLKTVIDDGEVMKLGDIRRIVAAVKNARIEDSADGKSIAYQVIHSLYATPENFNQEAFTYERLGKELRSVMENRIDQNEKIIPFVSDRERQWTRAQKPQSMVN